MYTNDKGWFGNKLDTLFLIAGEMVSDKGEDCYYCAENKDSAILGVFDGCGGLGSRTYKVYRGHTEAYMSSRIVSGAIHDWYHDTYKNRWEDGEQFIDSIKNYISTAFSVATHYAESNWKISGSMVRDFPTTAAMVFAQNQEEGVVLHIVWVGDSRIYIMDCEGLAQMTRDDVDGEDAMTNLFNDGVLTNVLSSDGRYELHYKRFRINQPTMVFAATDGCFGYVPTPMEFEYMLLNSLLNAAEPESFKKKLEADIKRYAGDDYTLGVMGFFYGDFANTKNAFGEREKYMRKKYINLLQTVRTEEVTIRLWKDYQKNYERYL